MLDFEEEEMIIHTPQVKKDENDGSNDSLSGDTKHLLGENNKVEQMPVSVDNQPVENTKKEYKPLNPKESKPSPLPDFNKKDYLPSQKKEGKLFWKLYAIVVTLLFILGVVTFGFFMKEGYLNPEFNFTSNPNYQMDLNPTITVPTSNAFNNQFNNTDNIVINFDLSDEFRNAVCNGS